MFKKIRDFVVVELQGMRAGKAEYPVMSFSEALQVAEAIKRDRIKTIDTLAKHLGHKDPSSGAFYDKAAAMNKFYGLLSQNKQEIELTQLGQRAVSNLMGENDRKAACRESVLRVGLFRDLYGKLGSDFNRSDFLTFLQSLTQCDVPELEAKAPRLEKLYLDAVRYLNGDEKVATSGGNASPGPAIQPSTPGNSMVEQAPAGMPPAAFATPQGTKPDGFRQYADGGVFARVSREAPPEEIELAINAMKGWLELAKKVAAKAEKQAN